MQNGVDFPETRAFFDLNNEMSGALSRERERERGSKGFLKLFFAICDLSSPIATELKLRDGKLNRVNPAAPL